MELLYILLIAVALILAWRGVMMFQAWRSRLRLKLEPVPPGPDIERVTNSELGAVRVRPRTEPVLHESLQAPENKLHRQSPAPSRQTEPLRGVSPELMDATADTLAVESVSRDLPVQKVNVPDVVVAHIAEPASNKHEVTVATLPLEAEQRDLFADEPIAPPPDRRQLSSRAQALYETPAVEPVRPVAKEALEKPVLDIEQVIALHVVARVHSFNGEDLLRCVLSYGLRFGDMSIFHRHEQPSGQGRVLFSMAKAVEPGTFALESMTGEDIPGVTFFLGLPGVNSITAYDIMVDTARRLATELQGDVLDENQQPLTRQLVDHYRERVQEFERRRLMNRPDGR